MDDELNPPQDGPRRAWLAYAGVLLLGLGGGYGASFLGGGGRADAAEHASPDGGGAVVPAEGAAAIGAGMAGPGAGSVITNLGAFTVNLRGSGGGRVLRMEVQLDHAGSVADAVDARVPQVRDTVLTAVSDYTWAELEGVDGKTRLRDELLVRVNGVLAPLVIDRVYFTQFVVQ